ncbi:MAG: BadF/BadG/BcrA/BcrD ATPase family protein [Acidimicrobiales bacterium]
MINWISRLPERTGDGLIAVVDGGATHSRVAITDASGTLAGYATGGPTNARSVGDDGAVANLVHSVTAALQDGSVDASTVGYCLVTSASIDTIAQSELLSDAVRAVLPSAVVTTVPDTMGCWASTASLGPAVAVISGTGSVVVAADRERGVWLRFGGWDYLLGDEGSGYGIGRAALQETLLVSEGRSEGHDLSAAVLGSRQAGEHHLTEVDGIPDAVHKPAVDKAWIASFAPLVLDLAARGDATSIAIVEREVAILADAAAAAVDALVAARGTADAGEPVAVGCFGGTFNASVLSDRFSAAVRARTEHAVELSVPEQPALVGAFAIALGWGGGDGGDTTATERLTAALTARHAPD